MALELTGLYLFCYLVGAVPTPYLIARWIKGIDIRQYGSGNVGGSNVIRQLGKRWMAPLAAIELLLKGFAPTLAAYALSAQVPELQRTSPLFLLAPLLALLGNNWSVFLKFHGGRGLMVICGMLIALAPLLFATAMAIYLVGWRTTRSSAIWALIAVALLPILAMLGPLSMGWPDLFTWMAGNFAGNLAGPAGAGETVSIVGLCLAILGILVAKRLMANSMAIPEDHTLGRVLWNRLLLDRDLADREEWVNRVPQ